MSGGHLKPSAVLVLTALQAAGERGLTTAELGQVAGFRYSARLLELRAAGYAISTVRLRQGSSRYTLLTPKPDPVPDGPGGQVEGEGSLALFDTPTVTGRRRNPYEDAA